MDKSGGRPKKETTGFQKEKTTGYSQKKPNVNVNDNVNVNVNDNDNVNVNEVSDSCVDGLQEIINFYDNNIGLITPHAIEVLEDYKKEMDTEVIIYAMKKAVESNIRTLAYIKGTLNNWSKQGIKTLLEAKEENKKFKDNKQDKFIDETEEESKARKIKELEELENGS